MSSVSKHGGEGIRIEGVVTFGPLEKSNTPDMQVPSAAGTAEGKEIGTDGVAKCPVSFEQTIAEAVACSQRLAELIKILENGGPSFAGSNGQRFAGY